MCATTTNCYHSAHLCEFEVTLDRVLPRPHEKVSGSIATIKKVILKGQTSRASELSLRCAVLDVWEKSSELVFTDRFFVSNTITTTSRTPRGSPANSYKNDIPRGH